MYVPVDDRAGSTAVVVVVVVEAPTLVIILLAVFTVLAYADIVG